MTARRAPDGRWVAGVSGNPAGRRSSAVDFAALVAEHRGSDMRETLLAVYDKLATMARDGDVAAMRLLLDRLCAPASDVGLAVSVEAHEPQDPVAAARRITAMLALAARVQPSLAGDVCRTMLAAVGQEQFGEQLRDRLRELRGDASP